MVFLIRLNHGDYSVLQNPDTSTAGQSPLFQPTIITGGFQEVRPVGGIAERRALHADDIPAGIVRHEVIHVGFVTAADAVKLFYWLAVIGPVDGLEAEIGGTDGILGPGAVVVVEFLTSLFYNAGATGV